jgi:hypothetical protein
MWSMMSDDEDYGQGMERTWDSRIKGYVKCFSQVVATRRNASNNCLDLWDHATSCCSYIRSILSSACPIQVSSFSLPCRHCIWRLILDLHLGQTENTLIACYAASCCSQESYELT